MNLYFHFFFHDNSIPALLKPVAVKVDYFAPIQKALDNHKEATSSTMLLSEHSKSSKSNVNTEQQTSSSSSSLKKKNNRKRARTSDTTAILSGVTKSSSSDKESDLCTASKKKRRSFQKSSRRLNREFAISAEIPTTTTTTTKHSAFETDFNIQISSFTENTYIPVMRKEKLMGRYFESLVNDPAEPVPYEPKVTDDAVFQVSMFEAPEPDSDDYLESLQKRFCFHN